MANHLVVKTDVAQTRASTVLMAARVTRPVTSRGKDSPARASLVLAGNIAKHVGSGFISK